MKTIEEIVELLTNLQEESAEKLEDSIKNFDVEAVFIATSVKQFTADLLMWIDS